MEQSPSSGRMGDIAMESPGQEEEMHAQAKLGFARKLASPNKRKRDKAISLLCLWLTSQKEVREDELRKIWKGLFYCVWHADKPPVQADLIERLASLMEKLDIELSLLFFKVFLTTMRREWSSIDRIRLDKFYLLLRKYLSHMFAVLENYGWDADLTRNFMDALVERTFLTKDQYAADGINLHCADIFLRELKRFSPLRVETFQLLLEPFWMVLAKGCDKVFIKRVKENVFSSLFDLGCRTLRAKQEGQDLDEIVENFGSIALTVPISSKAIKIASLPSTPQSNRRMLYELHEEFSGLEKLLAQSGISIGAPSVKRQKVNLTGSGLEVEAQAVKVKGSPRIVATDLAEDKGKKDAFYSPEQVKSGRSLSPGFEKRKKTSSPLFLKAGTVSTVIIEVNENVPPELELRDSLVNGSFKACPQQAERAQICFGAGKVSSTEKKRKRNNGKVFGVQVTEFSPEKLTQAAGNAELCKRKERPGSSDKRELDRVAVLKAETDGIEDTMGEVHADKSTGAGEETIIDEENARLRVVDGENALGLDDSVISNLENRFNSIAAEGSTDLDTCSSPISSLPLAPSPVNTGSKKRKSWKSSPLNFSDNDSPLSVQENRTLSPGSFLVNSAVSIDSTSSKKAKKVSFSLNNNLVWKPYSPLPPHILRVPPSATPRGSALKKGVPPGPIIVMREVSLKQKKAASKRTPPSAHRTPKSLKSSIKRSKLTTKGRLSPR